MPRTQTRTTKPPAPPPAPLRQTARPDDPLIYERVKDLIVQQLELTGAERDKVTPHAEFHSDLRCDSLDLVEMVIAMEEEFGIEIPDDDVEGCVRVSDVVTYLERRLGAR